MKHQKGGWRIPPAAFKKKIEAAAASVDACKKELAQHGRFSQFGSVGGVACDGGGMPQFFCEDREIAGS